MENRDQNDRSQNYRMENAKKNEFSLFFNIFVV